MRRPRTAGLVVLCDRGNERPTRLSGVRFLCVLAGPHRDQARTHQQPGSVTFDPAPATLGEPTIRADTEGKEISMGMRRRARRRGLVAGAVAGGAIAHHRANREQQDDDYQEQTQYAPPPATSADELEHLAQLHSSGVLSDDEFAAAKAKVLGT